jgi:hypothetical protein
MMNKTLRYVLINSTLAFVSAFIISTFIHELGHYISYFIFGANPTLYHNYVQTPDQQINILPKIISALAGPLGSLIQGIVLGLVIYNKQKNTAGHLFYLWLSLLGFVNFFGYLVMTPLSTVGDTGKVAELLNIDYSIRIVTAILGLILLVLVIFKIGRNFSNFIPAEHDMKGREKYVYHIMFFPILIGSIMNTLLGFPVTAFLSIIYPATSSYIIMSSFSSILNNPNPQSTIPEFENKIMKSMVILLLSVIILNRLLTFGLG